MYTLIILMNLIIGSRAGDALPCIDLALNATVFSLFDFLALSDCQIQLKMNLLPTDTI